MQKIQPTIALGGGGNKLPIFTAHMWTLPGNSPEFFVAVFSEDDQSIVGENFVVAVSTVQNINVRAVLSLKDCQCVIMPDNKIYIYGVIDPSGAISIKLNKEYLGCDKDIGPAGGTIKIGQISVTFPPNTFRDVSKTSVFETISGVGHTVHLNIKRVSLDPPTKPITISIGPKTYVTTSLEQSLFVFSTLY